MNRTFFKIKNAWFFLPDRSAAFQQGVAECRLSKGWYMITYQVLSESALNQSSLRFRSDEVVVENGSVSIPHRHGRISKRLCYINDNTNFIEFKPSEDNNNDKIKFLLLSRVSSGFARDRMLRKVINKHPYYRGSNYKKLWLGLNSNNHKKKIFYLYDIYNECIETPMEPPHTRFVSNPSVVLNGNGDFSCLAVDEKTAPRPVAPDPAAFEQLSPPHDSNQKPLIDVIIPVYKGYHDTLACIYSVLASPCKTSFELIVINDDSPDEALSQSLFELSQAGLITYLTNPANLGFVSTVNRGMGLHPDRDVVLLNSDTVVYSAWLDRLAAHAASPNVSTVTPLSNNATICSYPYENKNNQGRLEMSYADFDRLCYDLNRGKSLEIPTGIGYCMYIRRQAIKAVGAFDHKAFPRGYGEENDFCMRAMKKGYKNLFALDAFVRHTGEVSFSSESKELQDSGLQSVLKKHPEYLDLVNAYIQRRPAQSYRRRLDAARLNKATCGRSVLCVVHARTGGIIRYLRETELELKKSGMGLVTLSPLIVDTSLTYINTLNPLIVPNLCGLDLKHDLSALAEVINIMGVESISVNSLVDWSWESLELIPQLSDYCGLSYDFVVHDYAPICPMINMFNKDGYHCGEPDERTCQQCLDRQRSICGAIDIREWREKYSHLLRNARCITAPSGDAARRMEAYFPGIKVRPRPHEKTLQRLQTPLASPYRKGMIRVAVIGAINAAKGSHVLLACARDARRRNLPLQFVVVGHTDMDGAFGDLPNVEITGPYREEDVYRILRDQRCHISFLTSVCPETYCYTLSHALKGGFPCVSFDLGAQGERLRGVSDSLLLKQEYIDKPHYINNKIIEHVQGLINPL